MANDEPSSALHPQGGTATIPARKKTKQEHACSDTSVRNERHLADMWSLTRREIREIRQELKTEEDEDVIKELEKDVRILKKRKADYAERLGFPKDDMATEEV
ncbi:hypothetical protein ACHAXR_002865 [Thalassiosira sp. AJA248-18]